MTTDDQRISTSQDVGATEALTDPSAILPALDQEGPPAPVDRNDLATPWWFFQACERRYGRFDLDVAATEANRQVYQWLGPGSPIATDALACDWHQAYAAVHPEISLGEQTDSLQFWCNCPYGPAMTIPKWIAHARAQRDRHGDRTLMLLPADTSTEWYHDVLHTEATELVRFRLAFEAPDGRTKGESAKFGSVLVWIAPLIVRPLRTKTARQAGSNDRVAPDAIRAAQEAARS